MFYKISNIANKDAIERKFHVTFQFPNLYKPLKLIEGLKESTVAIITATEPEKVTYAIWGLLPENFEDNWSVFQDVLNTLNVRIETLQHGSEVYTNALKQRRCVIIATGFYTTLLNKGSVERCHVHLPNFEPFPIAAIFNELSDGFLTCALVLIKANNSFKNIPNISDLKPLVLNDDELNQWLDASTPTDSINTICQNHCSLNFVFEQEYSVT
ncbi:SOS response-associated peptidase family protein [Gelidibacter salicanalis]|uniref:Abasic site processing protein n=1 Tax=Gelidibacter salicanalis TaxID=291193 RepID=A0A934KWY5_9FLAO|nr:SOS response-associated peptidase family protein [Gelidibacter salicanalis]MBJ7880840.1 SOS response-associated peptidase family protein [Gelidibacter salicanalis]